MISFDGQPQIATNQVDPHDPSAGTDPAKECLNTVDADTPVSSVAALPAVTPINRATGEFTVSWSGNDDTGGSGLASYDIYVSDNDGPYTIWKLATTDNSATFDGQHGHTYRFYSVARDNVGLVETAPDTADATTLVQDSAVPMIVGWSSSATHGTVGEVLLSIPDVLQLAGPWWSGDSAKHEAPDEPWMTSLATDTANNPRKDQLGPAEPDVLAVSR